MANKSINLPQKGEVFGRLTITGNTTIRKFNDGFNRTMVEAQCECEDVRFYLFKYLKNGDTKSCGCYRNAMVSKAVSKHNLSKHPVYSVYQDMKRRCYEPKCKSFIDYGARGIIVCDEWLNDVKSFYDWSLENGWQKGLFLDRIENDGNYQPNNCRFIIKAESNKNTRRTILITAFGETKCGVDWIADERCKVTWNGLKERIKSGKWSIEDAISTGSNAKKKEFSRSISTVVNITAFGETKCLMAWSEDKRCMVGYSGLKIRLRKGWDVEKAISTPSRMK